MKPALDVTVRIFLQAKLKELEINMLSMWYMGAIVNI
jgi:hypothetical protein